MKFQAIVCAIDFSLASRKALEVAVTMAKRFDATLTLLHVYPTPGYVLPEGFVVAAPEALVRVDEAAHAAMDQWVKNAETLGAPQVTGHLAMGHPASEVERWLISHPSDLLVLGSHGHSAIGSMLLGSVADRLARTVGIPLLLVPGKEG